MYDFEHDPRLGNIHPLKLQIIKQLANSSTNKSIEQMIPDMMRLNTELSKRKLPFTKNERDLLMDILAEQASPEDKRKIAMIRSIM